MIDDYSLRSYSIKKKSSPTAVNSYEFEGITDDESPPR